MLFDAAKIEKKLLSCNGWAHKSSSGHMLAWHTGLCRGSSSLSASARIFVPVGFAALCRGSPSLSASARIFVPVGLAGLCRGSSSLSASARIFVPVGLAGLCRGSSPDGREGWLSVGKPDVKLSVTAKSLLHRSTILPKSTVKGGNLPCLGRSSCRTCRYI